MSDFDKEAERERLREKYERDKQKRETTEKMSELLLQGATMTNAHCSDCNDPIFRYDGQEFCATCEKPVDRGTDENENTENEGDERENGQSAGAIEVTSPSDDARVSFGGNSSDETVDDRPDETKGQAVDETPHEEETAEASAEQPRQPTKRRQQHNRPTREQSSQDQPPHAGRTDAGNTRTGDVDTGRSRAGGADADVAATRDSLVRTLRRFSEQAERCEDPQRAREYLAAAREAAETLDALRQ